MSILNTIRAPETSRPRRDAAAMAVALAALASTACGGQDASTLAALRPEPASDAAGADAPVYALLTQVYNADDRTVYISLSHSLDIGEVDLSQAREYAGVTNFNAIGGRILVSSGEAPTITEFEITPDLRWVEGRTVGFDGYPLSDNANWYYQFVLDDHTAYLPFDGYKRIVWDPTDMLILGTMENTTLAPELGTLQIEAGGNRNGIRYDSAVRQAFFYHDEDWYRFGPDSVIVSYDPVTHAEGTHVNAPCAGLAIATADEAGYTYFSTFDYLPGLALYGEGPAPCAVRLTPEGALDEAWTTDFTALTGGRYVTNFRYVGGGRAVGNVLDADALGVDFTQGVDPEVVGNLWQSGPQWRFWSFDLNAQTAQPIEGVDVEIGSSAQFAVLDGRTFVFLPYDDAARTKVYEIEGGVASEHLDVPGDVFKWIRVR